MPDELNNRQLYELKNAVDRLDRDVRSVQATCSAVQEALEGKGKETGMRQEMREIRLTVEGKPPKFQDGVLYAIELLGTNHTALRNEFDKHVETQDNDRLLNQGKRSGLSELWRVILAVLGFLGTAVTLYVATQQAVTNAIGGG